LFFKNAKLWIEVRFDEKGRGKIKDWRKNKMNKWIFVSEIVVILLIIVISITILHKILSKPKEKQWNFL